MTDEFLTQKYKDKYVVVADDRGYHIVMKVRSVNILLRAYDKKIYQICPDGTSITIAKLKTEDKQISKWGMTLNVAFGKEYPYSESALCTCEDSSVEIKSFIKIISQNEFESAVEVYNTYIKSINTLVNLTK